MEGEVGKSRLAEYLRIEKEVDDRAQQLTREELGIPEGEWCMGACHTFWAIKKQILREEYGIIWRSPQDLHPDCMFD